jgi:hypothetical protein
MPYSTEHAIEQNPQPCEEREDNIERAIEDGTLSADDWCNLDLDVGDPIFGTPDNCIVRPGTKNIILASEKSFKTTFTLRLMLGLSSAKTVFPELPVREHRRVLYVHGELSPPEIKERTRQATVGLDGSRLYEARNNRANLCSDVGQQFLEDMLERHKERGTSPEVLVLDPWQSFITGADENSFKEMSAATNFIEDLINAHRLTVFIVVHTGKDRFRGPRGHSLLAGWRDTGFTLDRKSKKGNQLSVTVEPRWAPPVPSFSLQFKNGTLWPTNSLTPDDSTHAGQMIRHLKANGGTSTKEELGKILKDKAGKPLKPDARRKAVKRAIDDGHFSIDGDIVRLPDAGEGMGLQPQHPILLAPFGLNGHPP